MLSWNHMYKSMQMFCTCFCVQGFECNSWHYLFASQRVACLLRKVVQEIERRISTQNEHLRTVCWLPECLDQLLFHQESILKSRSYLQKLLLIIDSSFKINYRKLASLFFSVGFVHYSFCYLFFSKKTFIRRVKISINQGSEYLRLLLLEQGKRVRYHK